MRKTKSKFRKFLSYYRPYKGLFAANMIAAMVAASLSLALPLCVRYITGTILVSGSPNMLAEILKTGALMAAIMLVQTAAAIFNDWMGHVMGAKIERDLREELFAHYQKLSFRFYDGKNTGELLSRLTNDLLGIAEVSHHVPILVVSYSIQLIGTLVILLTLNQKLALIILLYLPVVGAFAGTFYKRLQRSYRINQERIADINAAVQENLSGIRVVKTFANEKEEIKKFSIGNHLFYRSRINIYRDEAKFFSTVEYFFTPFVTLLIVVAGGLFISAGALEAENLLVFVLYAAYLTGPIPKLAGVIPFYQSGIAGFARFLEIMETWPDITDAQDAGELAVTKGCVSFNNVTFRYAEEYDPVLRNISFEVQPGETIAIVGRSGVGKSTLCALIPRLYDVSGGAVLIDGVNIRDVTLRSLRTQIGVVQQETFLFSGTVMENILYANPEATADMAMNAAKKANAHDFIMALPNKYETQVGQRGVLLSGGQRQRLSIARVYLRNPPILLFDEATSALDPESEEAVMESMRTLSEGRTTLLVAHRLSTVRHADRIFVLTEEGIAEQGTHKQLLAKGGVYAKLNAISEQ